MIAGLLLAAGASRRFGANKLLAPLRGRPVARWSAEALVPAVDATYVVVAPPESAKLREALAALPVRWVENAAAHEGMSSSIRAGMAALPPDTDAVLVTLGDQPTLDARVAAQVVARWRDAPNGVVAVTTAYADGRGHPTLFGSATFPALSALDGDRGAREILESLGDAVAVVDVAGARPADVDTPEALAALARALG